MYARNSHSYTHLILALGIVRKPTVWRFMTSQYPGIHDIGLPAQGLLWARGRAVGGHGRCGGQDLPRRALLPRRRGGAFLGELCPRTHFILP